MFGEHPSESPRVPSPWDPFLPSPPSGCSADSLKHIQNGVPKLVPEVEEGNIEYKLKLTHISPARFARLVTQLKWRLLEGGGQACYELGVADSGALIGLSRADLEASLETLDRMAGEIGASVIVVKEIEVPPAMYTLADEASRYIDPRTGEWARRMHARRRTSPLTSPDDDTTTTETTETETELDTTDMDDDDTSASAFPSDLNTPAEMGSPRPAPPLSNSFAHGLPTHPNRPSAQSSPYISPFDDDLAMFSMEPEPPHLDIDTAEDPSALLAAPGPFVVDLEIASVYKPRPLRRSAPLPAHSGPMSLHGRAGRRAKYDKKETGKGKKVHPWQASGTVPTLRKGSGSADMESGPTASIEIPNREETKAALRRQTRERRREEKRRALLATSDLAPGASTSPGTNPAGKEVDAAAPSTASFVPVDDDLARAAVDADLVSDLEALHVGVDTSVPVKDSATTVPAVDARSPEPTEEVVLHTGEPRVIVEALVVRKQSLEETFLDFGGFRLV